MECQIFEGRLDDWFDGLIEDERLVHAQEIHAQECRQCGALVARERQIRSGLRNMPVSAPQPGFAREALRAARFADRAVSDRPATASAHWSGALAGASIASCCFAVFLWVWQPDGLKTGQSAPPLASSGLQQVAGTTPHMAQVSTASAAATTVALTIGKVESFRLKIDAPQAFDQVNFSVDLPDNVHLAGQPGIRAITWTGRLAKGANVLELPVVAGIGASGIVSASVNWGEFERRIQANVMAVSESGDVGRPAVDGSARSAGI